MPSHAKQAAPGALLAKTTPTPDPQTIRDQLAERRRTPGGPPLDLRGARLIGEDLSGIDLSQCDLSQADLSRANLEGARLFGAKLIRATFFEANLERAELSGADLCGANLAGANLRNAGLGHAKLEGAELRMTDLAQATLIEADLTRARFSDACLAEARLKEANLEGADFSRSDLRGALLDGSTVSGARFDGADLRGAQLRALVGFRRARWIGVDVREIDFTGAHLCRAHILDENYIEEFRRQSRWTEVIYRLWSLTSDCGRSATRWSVCTLTLVGFFSWLYTQVGIDYGDHPTGLSPIYFSVVTITTLGYGDVTPSTLSGQIVAMVQVVTGYVMLGGLLSILTKKMASRAD